ncbi:MAG: hypothetical protein FWC71_07730 [Defluviitaleaceae bacterium]|nr:hypothetical protein [Defluviitaleaceae bacterium]
MFGDNAEMLPNSILYVKKDGYVAVSFPGLKYEFGENVPPEMQPFWAEPLVARCVRGMEWLTQLFRHAAGI